MCIDRLGAALCRLSDRTFTSPYRYDGGGHLRVIARPVAWADILDLAFNEIRQYGRRSGAVTLRLLVTIACMAERVTDADERAALLRQAMMIERGGHAGLPEEQDRQAGYAQYENALRALAGSATRSPTTS